MKKNEHGFTYPLTLCLLIIFLASFSFYIERWLVQKKISTDTALILTTEYYLHSSTKKIEATLQSNGNIPATGTFYFLKGKVVFRTDPPSGTTQIVNFTLSLNPNVTIYGKGTYDLQTKKLIKWTN